MATRTRQRAPRRELRSSAESDGGSWAEALFWVLQPVDDGSRQCNAVVGEAVVAVEGQAADLTLVLSADRIGQSLVRSAAAIRGADHQRGMHRQRRRQC